MQSLSVGQLALHIRSLLESDPILTDIWVSGEVSNLSRPASGHVYFSLKDERAQLRCALFRQHLTVAADMALEHGAAVLAHGYVSFYEARGELQLYVDAVQPAGVGVLAAEFERLRGRLEAEGLFEEGRKRPLPLFPRKIGLVTSASGAVLHDVCHVLARRWPLVELVLAHTLVQGDGASGGIVSALQRLNRRKDIDVIILARGGGSLEDLWAFNEEAVARAIFASRIPVVSAIGHETDYTIADYVADKRAPTPSAAADLVVPDQIEVAIRIGAGMQRMRAELQYALDARRQAVERARRNLQRCRPKARRLAEGVLELLRRMHRRLSYDLALQRERLESRTNQLTALSPTGTLARGYALVQRADGAVIMRAADTHPGEAIEVRMADGGFGARVDPAVAARPSNGATRSTAGAGKQSKMRAMAAEQTRLF